MVIEIPASRHAFAVERMAFSRRDWIAAIVPLLAMTVLVTAGLALLAHGLNWSTADTLLVGVGVACFYVFFIVAPWIVLTAPPTALRGTTRLRQPTSSHSGYDVIVNREGVRIEYEAHPRTQAPSPDSREQGHVPERVALPVPPTAHNQPRRESLRPLNGTERSRTTAR
jgi:hypothetical protein